MQFIIALFTGDIGVYAVFKFHYKSMLHLFIPCTPGLSSPPFNYLLLRKLPIYNLACIVQLNVLVNDLNPDLMFRVRFCPRGNCGGLCMDHSGVWFSVATIVSIFSLLQLSLSYRDLSVMTCMSHVITCAPYSHSMGLKAESGPKMGSMGYYQPIRRSTYVFDFSGPALALFSGDIGGMQFFQISIYMNSCFTIFIPCNPGLSTLPFNNLL